MGRKDLSKLGEVHSIARRAIASHMNRNLAYKIDKAVNLVVEEVDVATYEAVYQAVFRYVSVKLKRDWE